MTIDDKRFTEGLEGDRMDLVRSAPKSDLHNHAALGFRREVLARWSGREIAPPPQRMDDLAAMDQWIKEEVSPLYNDPKCLRFALRAPFAEAWNDGVTLLEMSFDITFIKSFHNNPGRFAEAIAEAHKTVAPDIDFKPELGIARDLPPEVYIPLAKQCIDTGGFTSIDLYGTEKAQPPEKYTELFHYARTKGLKTKVHSGEFGNVHDMMHTIKVLQPDAVQHGIAAAHSEQAMKTLAAEYITLNICPTSNIRLSRVKDYATHPIKTLFHAGVSVTINSDDIMVFEQNVSDEYLNLYRAGLFSATELNSIRTNGLKQACHRN